jgi:hypothetical protein
MTAAALPVARPIPVAIPIVAARRPCRPRHAVGRGLEWLFGVGVLVGGLATLSAFPLLQFLSLGYLLEAAGRVARTGRVRDGFIGVRKAARIGGIAVGVWLFLLPARIVADFAHSAEVIDPSSSVVAGWRTALYVLIGLTAVHIIGACGRGGRLRHFLNPLSAVWLGGRLLRGGFYAEARDAVWATVVGLRLPHYFWLGVRGFVVGLAWLAVPATLLAAARNPGPGAGLAGVVGAVLLAWVVLYLPFLQTRLAMTDRFRAGFQLGAVRQDFNRAPWAFAVTVSVTVLFAVPLYLLKIETVPRDAAWLPGVVFVGFIFPARVLAGWAVGRANRRERPRHWVARWLGRAPLVPVALAYVLVVFLARYTDWTGVAGVYAQHAFLLPVPFVGL